MQLKIKSLDILRYGSLSKQAFLKVCEARLYIAFGNGALWQATQTKIEFQPQRISRIRVGNQVASPMSVVTYVTECESRREFEFSLHRELIPISNRLMSFV